MTQTSRAAGLFQPHLRDMAAYAAVDPPNVVAERLGVSTDKIVKIDGNENPYGSSPKVAEALAGHSYHVYPDPAQREVRQALSEYTGAPVDNIVAGAGADELIDLLARLFLGPGDQAIDLPPTFGMYPVVVQVQAGELLSVHRDEAFDVDVEAVRSAIGPRTKLLFLANPNNPTGTLSSDDCIRALLDLGIMVVVDETYHEFCGATVAPLIDEYDNLVILRTLSKWAGLAGMRLGYGIMSPIVAERLMTIKPPYNLTVASEVALLASLADRDALLANVATLVHERDRMAARLSELPGLYCYPSHGNFLLCRFPPGTVHAVQQGLARRGVFVRYFRDPSVADCLRISAGTPAQTDVLLQALTEVLEEQS